MAPGSVRVRACEKAIVHRTEELGNEVITNPAAELAEAKRVALGFCRLAIEQRCLHMCPHAGMFQGNSTPDSRGIETLR